MPQIRGHSGDSPAHSANGSAGFRISTDGLPANTRITAVNRAFRQGTLGSTIEALGDQPLHAVFIERVLPGLSLTWASSSPIRSVRTRHVLANGSDSVLFAVVTAPRISVQFGREYSLVGGEGLAVGNPGAADTIHPSTSKHFTVVVPRKSLGSLLRDKSTHFVQRVSTHSGAMQLLVSYLDALKDAVIAPALELAVGGYGHRLLGV